mgnify:CR=1 FL=1
MRILNILLALGLTIGLLSAQQQGKGKGAPPAPKEYTSAAEIQAMIAKSKNDRKDGQAIVNSAILRLAPYAANMEYRASVGPAAVHAQTADQGSPYGGNKEKTGGRKRGHRQGAQSTPACDGKGGSQTTPGWRCALGPHL